MYITQGDQIVSVHLMITVQKARKNILNCFTYYDNVVSTLNTVFENTVWRVDECLETGGGHFEQNL
jgi:hypothetical protein